MPLPAITNEDRLNRCLSSFGVVSFSDHDEDGNADSSVVQECIDYGIAEVLGRLSLKYEVAQLANVPVLSEYATIIAARTLCTRRGNPIPESLEMRYQEITSQGGILDRLAAAKIRMIDANGAPVVTKRGFAPSHANLTVDRRFAEKRIRVVDGQSNMGTTNVRRDVDRQWNYE